MSTSRDVTHELRRWRDDGNPAAAEAAVTALYDSLRRIAAGYLRHEPDGHTLSPTALVHEAYLRLGARPNVPWRDRSHFLAVTARVMRRVLVDHSRRRCRDKRGGGVRPRPLDAAAGAHARVWTPSEVLDLDAALTRLADLDERKAKVVEARFFGGLTVPEIAAALSLSDATVHRELRRARAWLFRELAGDGETGGRSTDGGESGVPADG